MSIYLIIGIVVWLYALSILKRAGLSAFHFIVGSAGLFFILISLSDPYWIWFFTHAVINGVKWVGDVTGMCDVMNRYGLVAINNPTQPVMMSIDYECSGIIETTAYIGMVAFSPMYNSVERVFFGVVVTLWIYGANVIRLTVVVTIVHFMGGGQYYLAHTIIGRLVFYTLVIAMYYNVFTYTQVSHSLYRNFIKWRDRWRKRLSFRKGD
ncbi:exosortase family protein XrtG [Secundilactobacillus paracollinoides]|uniref:Exosortase family protein XrtG n=1 Tax=Secundilactobacillus paracollinoides TaxID=240427 RepID=A0A1B2IUI4_9LACO|nr:exosortase family protein XrtG [Secundilactobacillus paracollinoides]ANZ59916.1 exosortase family protein XrtG [Secundilactobacillus paracollinoides]ANZ63126.1 exosortase family protein XrtG [Secundilactobacillus paracollinoides]ANZ65707.1 exosortase family protein XrtG [Secundilactobacillus paracollinoides]